MTGLAPAIRPLDAASIDRIDWRGDIVCERVAGRSALTRCYARAPLKLLTPNPIGDAAHVVMSSFGGGLVSGDDVPLRVRVDAGASCVLSTQSSSKVYRSDGRTCSQSLHASVATGGLLAVLPDPLACFAEARLVQTQSFDLAGGGNLVWLDWLTSGRWACDERWAFASLRTRADIRIDGRLRVREALQIDSRSGDLPIASAMRLGRFNCYAVLAVIGPAVAPMIEEAKRIIADLDVGRDTSLFASLAPIDDDGVVVRILGPDMRDAQRLLRPIVAKLETVIGSDPWGRKW